MENYFSVQTKVMTLVYIASKLQPESCLAQIIVDQILFLMEKLEILIHLLSPQREECGSFNILKAGLIKKKVYSELTKWFQ